MTLFDDLRKDPDLAIQWMANRKAASEIDRDVVKTIIAEAVADEVRYVEIEEIEEMIDEIRNVDWDVMRTIWDVIELLQLS
jgi:DNA-binding FrmR family transcriptional regulator